MCAYICTHIYVYYMGVPGGSDGSLPATQEAWVWSLGQEDTPEKGMATHSIILTWRIPWTEEPAGLWSVGSQRVGHNWSDLACSISLKTRKKLLKFPLRWHLHRCGFIAFPTKGYHSLFLSLHFVISSATSEAQKKLWAVIDLYWSSLQ